MEFGCLLGGDSPKKEEPQPEKKEEESSNQVDLKPKKEGEVKAKIDRKKIEFA